MQELILQKLENCLKGRHDLRLCKVLCEELFKLDLFFLFQALQNKLYLLLDGEGIARDLAHFPRPLQFLVLEKNR